jgi:hypothetical protein
MDRGAVEQCVAGYERLWRTPGTDRLVDLFLSNATYRPSPGAQPIEGLDKTAKLWDAERDGADEEFTMSSDVVGGTEERRSSASASSTAFQGT